MWHLACANWLCARSERVGSDGLPLPSVRWPSGDTVLRCVVHGRLQVERNMGRKPYEVAFATLERVDCNEETFPELVQRHLGGHGMEICGRYVEVNKCVFRCCLIVSNWGTLGTRTVLGLLRLGQAEEAGVEVQTAPLVSDTKVRSWTADRLAEVNAWGGERVYYSPASPCGTLPEQARES